MEGEVLLLWQHLQTHLADDSYRYQETRWLQAFVDEARISVADQPDSHTTTRSCPYHLMGLADLAFISHRVIPKPIRSCMLDELSLKGPVDTNN